MELVIALLWEVAPAMAEPRATVGMGVELQHMADTTMEPEG